MRFGVLLSALTQPHTGQPLQVRMPEIVDVVHAARDLGFDYVSTGQHFLGSPFNGFQSMPLVARLIPETGSMRIFTTVLLSISHPVEVAEQLATLDLLSEGRLGVTIARGYRPEEFAAFGIAPEEATARLLEALECVLELWRGEPVTRDGRYFALHDAGPGLVPMQVPHPPIWYAAGAEASARRAGRRGLVWSAGPDMTRERFDLLRQHYLAAFAQASHVGEPQLALGRDFCCASSVEAAHTAARAGIAAKFEAYREWGLVPAGPRPMSQEELVNQRAIVGDAHSCVQTIREYADLGVSHLHFRVGWKDTPVKTAITSLERFASEVRPHLTPAHTP